MEYKDLYNQVLEEAKNDPDIIGLVLTAGRGKGMVTEFSDYDFFMIVKDEKIAKYKEKYESLKVSGHFDIFVFSLSEFKEYAVWGSAFAWDRYNFSHLTAQVDKTGEIQKIIDEKGIIPKDQTKDFVTESIDAYINLYYRAIKNNRDGNKLAAHLDAVESIGYLLNTIFGLEGRLRPYNKYLEWELEKYPLSKLPWTTGDFLNKLEEIMATDNIEVQKEIFQKIKGVCQKNGYSEVIDEWEGYYLG